jgi:16S rRNA (guanine527-N7)-methyltransferase
VIVALSEAAARPVSRETFDLLTEYAALLRAESARQNLVSKATLDDIWQRHILDSAQLDRFEPRPGSSWVDVGSGAGLPGIVIAALVRGPVTLIEPRRLRADFLTRVNRQLNLGCGIFCGKIERVAGKFDVITGRAVAPLTDFLRMCHHSSTEKTVWVLPKGRLAQSELAEVRQAWQGAFDLKRSVTDEESYIIVGTGVRAKTE